MAAAAQVVLQISSTLWLLPALHLLVKFKNSVKVGPIYPSFQFGSLPLTPLAEIHLANRPGT